MARIKYFILLIFCVPSSMFSQLPKVGLFFNSREFNLDKRTSLILNDQKSYKVQANDIFSLKFDLFLRDETVKFGNVFRIITDKNENIDLVINNEQDRFLIISKHVNNESHSQSYEFKNSELTKIPIVNRWNQVEITFNKKKNQVYFKFNDNEMECQYDLSSIGSLLIYFGVCDYDQGLSVHDVSPMIIKDVAVLKNNKTVDNWALDKHAGNVVYDAINQTPAIVKNPVWMKDNSVYWKKVATFSTKNYPQITFDSTQNKVYIFNEDYYIDYSVSANRSQVTHIKNPIALNRFNNQLMFNELNGKVISYSINPQSTGFFDFSTGLWDNSPKEVDEPSHAHHNRYVSVGDTSLILFGGYGFYKYKSDLFKINLNNREWKKFDLSQSITPRYLSAMGANVAGDKVYIWGGRGAEKGLQELAPKNFSDLYEVELNSLETRQIYDFSDESFNKDFVYSNSLVVDEKDSCFYVLAYPNNKYSSYLILKKMGLNKPVEQTLGDTIEYYFQDITSYSDLYYSPSLSKLIAVAAYSKDNLNFTIQIYTLDYPPLSENDVLQAAPQTAISFKYLVIILLFVFIATSFYFIRKKNKFKKDGFSKLPSEILSTEDIEPANKFYPRNISSILFLGGFQVFNKKGENITGEFTPTLKYLLVLIVLYTLKDEKGISSMRLQDLLWCDKSEDSARNNRNVNIRKLRLLLAEIGDADISNKDGYWKMDLGKEIFSDYMESVHLIDKIKTTAGKDVENVSRLLELLSYGVLLPNIQMEWIDEYKNNFSNEVIDELINLLNKPNTVYANDPSIRLKMADMILSYDSISEEAIKIKCDTLFRLGKKGTAKTVFDNFTKEYKLLLGEPYTGSLSSLLK